MDSNFVCGEHGLCVCDYRTKDIEYLSNKTIPNALKVFGLLVFWGFFQFSAIIIKKCVRLFWLSLHFFKCINLIIKKDMVFNAKRGKS